MHATARGMFDVMRLACCAGLLLSAAGCASVGAADMEVAAKALEHAASVYAKVHEGKLSQAQASYYNAAAAQQRAITGAADANQKASQAVAQPPGARPGLEILSVNVQARQLAR